MNPNPSAADHLAELDVRSDAHIEAVRSRADDARAALDRAADALAESAGGPTPPE